MSDQDSSTENSGENPSPSDASGDQSAAVSTDVSSQPSGWFERMRQRFLGTAPASLKQVMEDALSDDSSGLSSQERNIIVRTLRFGGLRVEDVMVPRADVVAIDESATLAELYALFVSAGHSRIPVYQETLDDPRGMVHVKDLMSFIAQRAAAKKQAAQDKVTAAPDKTAAAETSNILELNPAHNDNKLGEPIDELADLGAVDLSRTIAQAKLTRSVLYVPPSMPVLNLLLRMQTNHVHLALVVDEYGGTDGIVSIEDLVEEIVGEIEDEHDADAETLLQEDKRLGFIASARVPVEELEERLDVKLRDDDDDIDTLGGLVFSLADRVPLRGELIRHSSGIEFEILDADPRRIKTLRIHRTTMREDAPAPTDAENPEPSTDKSIDAPAPVSKAIRAGST